MLLYVGTSDIYFCCRGCYLLRWSSSGELGTDEQFANVRGLTSSDNGGRENLSLRSVSVWRIFQSCLNLCSRGPKLNAAHCWTTGPKLIIIESPSSLPTTPVHHQWRDYGGQRGVLAPSLFSHLVFFQLSLSCKETDFFPRLSDGKSRLWPHTIIWIGRAQINPGKHKKKALQKFRI